MAYLPTSGHKEKDNMSVIIKEVYDAFVKTGVSEEKSTLAAKAIADDDNCFSRIESDLLILKWMVGLVIAVEVLPLLKRLVA
uniref:Uncharacterized protein n=1 Tax=Candidatus Kentrum eta TaxID=2126337 RepID=A0A450UPE5_9GAMM|nr:MAG: hypothetical protein BECKH772A_GA0070896_1007126 [Candidatus Kentron sp. H]VFJ95290.1 MAG: hypothetical protein BECKH772B_GA0070898_1007426 [Candidatus Kentron sp. H]VFK01699.1 MAG: hypothetical protein BECKH772C_GA0070978_1007026 [Candidatus Kentron sp. H]